MEVKWSMSRGCNWSCVNEGWGNSLGGGRRVWRTAEKDGFYDSFASVITLIASGYISVGMCHLRRFTIDYDSRVLRFDYSTIITIIDDNV